MKLTRTILSASLYLLAPASTFGHREFSKASSHTIVTAGVKLSNLRTSGRATTFLTKEAPARRDFEITNNSDDTREVLSIDPFKVMLQPTPSALTSEQISATIVTMKEILMVHFELGDEATELTLISGVDFDDGVIADFMPSKRMLRNGRSLVDGETTAAFSMMKVLGGYANVTYDVDIDPPSEAVLNESVRNILNQHLKDKLKLNIVGFEDLEEVVVTSYTPPQPQNNPPESKDNPPEAKDTPPAAPPADSVGRTMPVAASAALGSVAAFVVVAGLGFYAWKNGKKKKNNLNQVSSTRAGNSNTIDLPDEVGLNKVVPLSQPLFCGVFHNMFNTSTLENEAKEDGGQTLH